jgi:mono/diheme cytochrome c family protein
VQLTKIKFKTSTSILHPLSSIFHPLSSILIILLLLTGCSLDMRQQPKNMPLSQSDFFENQMGSRMLIAGTVAQGHLNLDKHLYEGKNPDGSLVDTFPFEITPEVMARGQQEYNVFCSPCHGYVGNGQGMIVQRGFKTPPSFHLQRLHEAPAGHFFDVITNGFGVMYPYAYRIAPEDRWAIIAYIRALQLSQNATLEDVPPDQRAKLEVTGQ